MMIMKNTKTSNDDNDYEIKDDDKTNSDMS